MADFDLITVEVAYALPHQQKIVSLLVEPGTTALEAVVRSKIIDAFPGLIDLQTSKMGIFGQALGSKGTAAPEGYVLKEGDRVEIYRPLTSDPMDARRRRAEKAAKDAANP